MAKTNLSGALQENVLTLLCFDDSSCPHILAAVDVSLFESAVYQRIAERAFEYYRQYQKAPGDHLPDILEDVLSSKKKREVELYERTLQDIYRLHETINSEYVLGELDKFVRQQSLRKSITKAAGEIQSGDIDAAEKTINEGLKTRLKIFDPGTSLSKAVRSKYTYAIGEDLFHTGIDSLDDLGICPARKELFGILAPANRGKTWALIHFGKYAALQRAKVLHITLEMSEEKIARRYIQSFFSVTRRSETVKRPTLVRDKKGLFTDFTFEKVEKRPSMQDKNITKTLTKKFDKLHDVQIKIKQFPTGYLTTDALVAYLEMLENDGYIPDVLIVDYADLMYLNSKYLREETSRVYKDLRGIAVDRNLAGLTASQTNRAAEGIRIVTMKHFAEDYSKAAICDNWVTYNQTEEEKSRQMARLFVAKARDEGSSSTFVIAQAYKIGQFCLDSVRMSSEYWDVLDDK